MYKFIDYLNEDIDDFSAILIYVQPRITFLAFKMKFGIFIIFQIFIVTTIVCELHIGYDIVDILDQNCK